VVIFKKILNLSLFSMLISMLLVASGCASVRTEKIVFTSNIKGENAQYIYSMNLDGSNPIKLARWAHSAAQLSQMWSADGKILAFIDYDTESGKPWLSVVDSNGENRRRLLDVADFHSYTFSLSSDGRTIALAHDVSRTIETPMYGTVHIEITNDSDLFTVDVATGTVKQLTDTPDVWESYPAISPDGKKISFVVRIDTENKKGVPEYIYVMDINGNNRRELVYQTEAYGLQVFQGMYWSPDSKKIAYSIPNYSINDNQQFYDIFVIDVEKGGYTNLTESPLVIDDAPSWSPDSSKISYYSGSLEEGFYIWVMDADGKNKTKLYYSGGPPSWTPDGKGLIFTNRLNVYEVLVIDAKGENLRSLTKTEDIRISNPVWLRH
jgi:Tol biopolymer transport system component